MMQPIYILSASAISPQHSFEPSEFLQPIESSDNGKLFVVDPDYRQFINPVAIRRMSRQMKMGISAGMKALQNAGVEQPDAIITGTGLGSMTDMEHFLKDMIQLKEEALNPTYFIQSTYNSINGWIALQSKSTGYNQTYVNRGLSFELSLFDAQLFLSEEKDRKVALVGCFDELTPDYFIVKEKIGYWKKELPHSLDLLQHADTPGSIAGEGTAFFTLSNKPGGARAILRGVRMLQDACPENVPQAIAELLNENALTANDIDLVVTGMNGDARFQPLYVGAIQQVPQSVPVLAFKQFTGEYPTASGFALWLAQHVLHTRQVPEALLYRPGNDHRFRNILIINHYVLNTASVMLVSRL